MRKKEYKDLSKDQKEQTVRICEADTDCSVESVTREDNGTYTVVLVYSR